MSDFNSSLLQDIAVKCTQDFLNDKVPLSVGLAKEASAHNLNSDQVQRCVEATNTVALLKVRSLSDDRTAEFHMAKYAEVMAHIVTPTASNIISAPQSFDPFLDFLQVGVEKQASATAAASDEYCISDLPEASRKVYMTQVAAITKNRAQELETQAGLLRSQLMKAAQAIEADPEGLKKMAQVLGSEFDALAVLVSGAPAVRFDTGVDLYNSREVLPAKQLGALYKQACEVSAELASTRADLVKVAAFEQATKPTGGQNAAPPVTGFGAKIKGALNSPKSPFRQPSGILEKGIAKATETVIKPATAPLGAAARVTAEAASRGARTLASKTGLVDAPVKPASHLLQTTGRGLKAAVGTLGMGVDALSYSPGHDANTGRPKDVWAALEG
jgi:hypothetical protein